MLGGQAGVGVWVMMYLFCFYWWWWWCCFCFFVLTQVMPFVFVGGKYPHLRHIIYGAFLQIDHDLDLSGQIYSRFCACVIYCNHVASGGTRINECFVWSIGAPQ